MKKKIALFLWCIAALGLWCSPANAQASGGAYVGECNTDDEIATDIRQAIEKQATQIVGALLSADPAKAYPEMISDVKRGMTAEMFADKIRSMLPPDTSFSNVHLTHTYLETMSTIGKPDGFVPCTTAAHGDLSKPGGRVDIEVKPLQQQAYVTAEAGTNNNAWAVVLWLIPEDGVWHVGSFKVLPVSMVGKSAGDIWATAQAEQHKNHNFNAFILGVTALQLADRGPHFHLGIQSEIGKRLSEMHRPDALQGNPPFNWKLGDKSFKILNVGPIGVGGKIYLTIRQEIAVAGDDHEYDRQNHELITAFAKALPEYKEVFSGLVIEAVTTENQKGFRTVQEN